MEATPSPLRRLTVVNLREQIEKEVLNAILRGQFRPGERLVESTIADQLGVSRAPVREVLSALERDGLVVSIPRRGSFLIMFEERDIEEIYSLRLLVEVGALRRSIFRFSAADLARMLQFVDMLGQATADGEDPAGVVDYDLSFHEMIFRVADHGRMYAVWNSMRLQTQLLIGITSQTQYDYPEQQMEFHRNILLAIRNQDLAAGEARLRDHILDAQRRACTTLRRRNALAAPSVGGSEIQNPGGTHAQAASSRS